MELFTRQKGWVKKGCPAFTILLAGRTTFQTILTGFTGGFVADVYRLPGMGCEHHTAGRCLYEEHLNPGYVTAWRCRVMLHWEDAFDEFLARAECFGVTQDAVPDLWRRKFERMVRKTFACDKYVLHAEVPPPACAHECDGICRSALPRCQGRCRHYAVDRDDASAR